MLSSIIPLLDRDNIDGVSARGLFQDTSFMPRIIIRLFVVRIWAQVGRKPVRVPNGTDLFLNISCQSQILIRTIRFRATSGRSSLHFKIVIESVYELLPGVAPNLMVPI